MESKKRLLIFLALLFLTAIVAGAFLYQKKLTKETPPAAAPANKLDTEKLPVSEIPAGLPQNLPIEAGSKIIENYQTTTKTGTVQGTRRFTTKKSLDDALKVYVDFFTKTSWKVSSQQKENGNVSTILRRNDSVILVVVKEDAALNSNVVEITLTEPPTKTED